MNDNVRSKATISDLLDMLQSSDPKCRLHATEQLGDLLQYDAERPDAKMLTRNERAAICNSLIRAIGAKDQSGEVREAMLNSLQWGSSNDDGVAWDQLVPFLADLDSQCLEHAVTVLGNTGELAFVAVIEEYAASPNLIIRSAAEDALKVLMLGGCRAE